MYTYTSLYLDIKMYSRKAFFEVGHKYPIVWFNIVTPRRSSKTFPTPPVRDPSAACIKHHTLSQCYVILLCNL